MGAPPDCKLCPLSHYRTHVVNGRIVGTTNQPPLLIVGESPGAAEDAQGKPFVGPTGAFLAQELKARGITDYALTNAMRCFPGENKKESEMAAGVVACNPYLLEDIDEIAPKVILALGVYAVRALGFNDPMATILCHTLQGPKDTTVVVSYHPAFFFREPGGLHLFDLAVLKVRLLLDGIPYGREWPPQLLTLEEFKKCVM